MRYFAVIVLALLLSACGGGGGGSSDNDSNNTSNGTGDDNSTVTPSNTDSSSGGLNQFERQFATTFNSRLDFTAWGCRVVISNQVFAIILSLEESFAGTMLMYDSNQELVTSIEGGEWAADARRMIVSNVQEEKALQFSNYVFSDTFTWDSTIVVNGEDTDVECRLLDQDGNQV